MAIVLVVSGLVMVTLIKPNMLQVRVSVGGRNSPGFGS